VRVARVDLPAGTAGRLQSDEAFAAAGLDREVAYEVTSADYIARLVGVGMLPSGYAPQLTGVVTIEITDTPARVEYLIWAATTPTPAAKAFVTLLGLGTGAG
jgi:DNA-binding transcriptional LysR family regulator